MTKQQFQEIRTNCPALYENYCQIKKEKCHSKLHCPGETILYFVSMAVMDIWDKHLKSD